MGFCVCSWGLGTPQGFLSLLFAPSSAAAKMPSPQSVASGPELHSPREPVVPQIPAQGTRKANSEDASSAHREGLRPGLGTLLRAFSKASQRASGCAPQEDPGLLRRSSRLLFRSLRRARDEGPAADQTQATTGPGVAHGREASSRAMDGVSPQSSTGAGPAELEGEGSLTAKQGRKPRPERRAVGPRLPDRLSSPATPNPCPCTISR